MATAISGELEDSGGDCEIGTAKSSYVGIASLNTSVRDNKNLLEIRLERADFNVGYNLSQDECDHLLMIISPRLSRVCD